MARAIRNVLSYFALTLLAAFMVIPLVWMVLVSLHEPQSSIPTLDKLIPKVPHWENYTYILTQENLPVLRFFFNSVFVTVTSVTVQLFFTSMAGFAFARLQFRGREIAYILFLGSMMFAGSVTQIPVYLLLRSLGWLDTFWALIVPGVSSAFNVFLFRQFFRQIPLEIDEACRVDGATDWQIYSRMILPLSKAALATAGAFSFFASWTDFFGPLLYTNSIDIRTLEVGLSIFKNSYGGNNWPLQMTAAVTVLIPCVLVFLVSQRYFSRGVVLGSEK